MSCPVAIAQLDSIQAALEKAQQSPQYIWFLTMVTTPSLIQSTLVGVVSEPYTVISNKSISVKIITNHKSIWCNYTKFGHSVSEA